MAERLHAATIHLLRRLRAGEVALGISGPRLSALSELVSKGPMRIGELARAEEVEPPTMTRLVDAMERDGLLTREPDPKDRRAVVLRATAEGGRVLRRDRARRIEALAESLRALPPGQLRALARGVDALEGAIAR